MYFLAFAMSQIVGRGHGTQIEIKIAIIVLDRDVTVYFNKKGYVMFKQ